MDSSKKILLTTIGIAILICIVSGVTFAFFNYTRTGAGNTIRVGRISFVTRQTSTINLVNAFPIDSEDVDTDTDNVDEVVIEIEGDTDYADGIEYLVSSVDSNIYTSSGVLVPISLDIEVDGLGTENNNYFTVRDSKNANIYKQLVGDTLVGDQMLLVGYIKKNTTNGETEGVDGSITIKAYFDKDKILISDTYDGTESDNMGTTNSMAEGKTVVTTQEWNALQSSGLSFKVKVEANEGLWITGSLEEIMRKSAVMDNINSTYVNNSTPGIDFGVASSDTNGKGVYMRAGTQNDDYPIMYYRGAVEDNNVIFGNKCWKAVRTTDTGGVKLIYNGEMGNVYENVNYNRDYYSENVVQSGVGFTFNETTNEWISTVDSSSNNTTSIKFSIIIPGDYTLIYTVSSGGPFALKKGTSYLTSSTGINQSVALNGVSSSDEFTIEYTQYAPGSSNVVFSLLKEKNNVGIGCDNDGVSSLITVDLQNVFNYNDSGSPAMNGYMYGEIYQTTGDGWVNGARFGNSFMWDGTNYKLVDASVTTPDTTHHYSCNVADENGTCTNLRYVYLVSGGNKYYITLVGGDGIDDAMSKMQINTTNSNAKDKIDTWYVSNLTSYTNKLEDTIWCNDRSYDINGIGGLAYSGYYRNIPVLSCRKNDSFTVYNVSGNQSLSYPTALISYDEYMLTGKSTGFIARGARSYLLTPAAYNNVAAYNTTTTDAAANAQGLRPAISIKPGQLITKGTGTVADPYVIE